MVKSYEAREVKVCQCSVFNISNLQIVNAIEKDSGDYECQLTGDPTDHLDDEDLVLNQKLEINVFDKEKSFSKTDDESGVHSEEGRDEKTSKAESVLASFVQNDQLQVAKEKRSRLSRQERISDERTDIQRSSAAGSRLRVSVSLGLWAAALLCSVL